LKLAVAVVAVVAVAVVAVAVVVVAVVVVDKQRNNVLEEVVQLDLTCCHCEAQSDNDIVDRMKLYLL